MAIGPFIRSLLGPLEIPISKAYRALFVDLDALASQIKRWAPGERIKILEIGCGEGIFTSHLAEIYPDAHIVGIDITGKIGRMYKPGLRDVAFNRQTIKDFAAQNASSFDLVVIVDVIHHIPRQAHREFLEESWKVLKPGGMMAVKEWVKNASPIHFLAHFLDRYVTGDHVCYKTTEEWRNFIRGMFGEGSVKSEACIRPWLNNRVFLVQL